MMGRRSDADRPGSRWRSHLKQHRARCDLTQEELARRVGVSRQTILAIEKARYVPSTLLALRLAGALGMRVEELFELLDEREGSGSEERDGAAAAG